MKENSNGTDTNVGSIENSIEEDIKMIEILKNKNLYINIKPKSSICIDCINKNKNKHIEAEVVINEKLEEAINYTLSNYKRVLKENEELKLYNNSITSQLEQMTTKKFKEGWIHQSEFKDFIPVQKVKDKIKEILKNGEYRIIFEGDAEFPDEATIITTKYLKLEKVQKLQRENERLRKQNKIMCDEYCPQIQKIKAKIEELDIAILECEYSDDDSEEYKKEVEKDKLELLKQKRVLQELLEGRK